MGNTILADVEPGDQTGIYYITICNLPFGTSWQGLKDYTREACDVDHVEVFPTSTSGWVRVKGKENFERAWQLLDGGHFNGRSIIASDKNRSEPIKIRELIQRTPASQFCQVSGSRRLPPMCKSYPSPSQLQGSFDQYSHDGVALNYLTQPVSYATYGRPLMSRSCDMTSEASSAISGSAFYGHATSSSQDSYDGTYPMMTHHEHVEYPCYEDAVNDGPLYDYYGQSDATAYVNTEQRKVLLTHIERKARHEDVAAWIRKKLGSAARDIGAIELPQHDSSGQLRGHGYIVLQSASAARKAVEALDQKKFQKRHVGARLTVEGLAVLPQPKSSSKKKEGKEGGSVIANGSSRMAISEKRR